MKITKSGYEQKIDVTPGQRIVIKFKTLDQRSKTNAEGRINIAIHAHCYITDIRKGSTNVVSSTEGIDINNESKEIEVILVTPEFDINRLMKTVLYIWTDKWDGVLIEGLSIFKEGESQLKLSEGKKFEYSRGTNIAPGGHREMWAAQGISISGIEKTLDAIIGKDTGLPIDNQNRIYYIRPWANDSFGVVGWHHITYMRLNDVKFGIEDVSWEFIKVLDGLTEKKNILVHPFLYPFASGFTLHKNIEIFAKLLRKKAKLGGFDVADSDKITELAAHFINKLDLMMVPSSFAKNTYIRSGVRPEIVQVLPHGVPDNFIDSPGIGIGLGEKMDTNNIEINRLKDLKKKGNILILVFCMHSEWRKGADIVTGVMKRIQTRHKNVILVSKSRRSTGELYPGVFNCSPVNEWMDEEDLRRLYDTCDILLSPSRGGGFELNTLESISRGVPTLVTNGGCFTDLMQYYVPINVGRYVHPLPGNPIHNGVGPECDLNDFENKLEDVINRLDYWKGIFRGRAREVGEKYSWKNTAIKLGGILKDYDFVR